MPCAFLARSAAAVAHPMTLGARYDDIEVRLYRPGDEAGIVACYNRVFPPTGMAAQDLEQWRWKFEANPVRETHIVVADHAREGIVGTYAAIPYRAWMLGREARAAQGVDLVVLPDWRRVGPPPGLFINLGRAYHETFCGDHDHKAAFFFGWPIPAWKHGHKYLGYQVGRDWDFLFRDDGATGFAARTVPSEVAVAEVQRFDTRVDRLFAGLRRQIGISLVKDAAYLNWRYAACPHRRYRLAECRDAGTGDLRGIAVYTVADLLRPHTSFLVDWLTEPDDEAVTVALIGWAEAQSNRDGTQVLATVFNQVDRRFLLFQRLGFSVLGSAYFVAITPYRHELADFRAHWQFALGDSDLI